MPKTPELACPAGRLALEAGRLAEAWTRADAAGDPILDELEDQLQLIEETAAHVRATSALGAFFQVLILRGELLDEAADKKTVRRLRRLACSIASQLETLAEGETVEQLRRFYFNREYDELAQIERAAKAA